MKSRRKRKKTIYIDLVKQRQDYIYRLAVEEARKGNYTYARELGKYLKEFSKSTGVRLSRHIKRGLCKNCSLPLIPGITASIRLKSQGGMAYKIVRCKNCGWIHRIPYRRTRKLGQGMEGSEKTPRSKPRRDNREEGRNEESFKRDRS